MITQHSRVALIDGADSVYVFALAGSEGWVRDHKKDDDGYELVLVEWDKEHWRYNGQPDGWTFESHFKVIGPPEPPAPVEKESEKNLVHIGDIDLEPPAADHQVEAYIDTLTEAVDAASESEAFLMIAVRRVPNPQNPHETMFVPEIFSTATSKEGALLLDIQLAECASTSYEEMVFNLIEQLRNNDGRT
jgi:hypothetical protein